MTSASDCDRVATHVHRLAALAAGGVPLESAWRYLDLRRADAEGPAWALCLAALDVAAAVGSPVAAVLERTAALLRDRAAAIRAVDVALAGPRATAKLVSCLPVVGVLFGMLLGLDPLGALFGSQIGLVALTLGVLLSIAAWLWSRRIVTVASRGDAAAGGELELVTIALAGGCSIATARAAATAAIAEHGLSTNDSDALDDTLALATAAGIPARGLLAAEAAAVRVRAKQEAEARAARASIALVVPLGVCVLPAFALLAIVPLVLSMLQGTVLPG